MFFKQRVPEEAVERIVGLAARHADAGGPQDLLVAAVYGKRASPNLPMLAFQVSAQARKAKRRIGAALVANNDAVLVNPDALRAAISAPGAPNLKSWKQVERALRSQGYEVIEVQE